MKRLLVLSACIGLLAIAGLSAIAGVATAQQPGQQSGEDSASARKVFANPPREYSTAPLWVWNDMLTEDQIRGTLGDLAGQKVRQAFVHPRPGLMTPYLSADWFRLWKVALDEAEKLDMNIWIYDENSYPSGFAGGFVPQQMPESRGRGLTIEETTSPPKPGPSIVAVYRIAGEARENVTAAFRAGAKLAQGRYVVASVVRAKNSPWHGDRCYVDLMYPGVTEKFLNVTLDAYYREIGDQFGKRVLGAFTDEPNIRPAGGLPWTDHLPQAFKKRWGYDLLDHLPSLAKPVGRWKQVRHDYFQVLVDQYIEHWAQPYYDWCEKHGIAFTGHYWDHEWPNCVGVPDNMALSAVQHMPGIDCLMNLYREDTHAQFGNVRFVREVQSLCNQLGRKRFLCELYGAGGWDLRFEDMKRIADWLGVLGVNLFDEHLSYVTLRGARKADHPQSFSYHEPWWNSYHVVAEYITRLSAAMTRGEQKNRILVIEPTTTAWMYQEDPAQAAKLTRVGKTFFDLLLDLERAQVEYDIGCEDVIARHGSLATTGVHAEPKRFTVGQRQYTTVVLPPVCETLRAETMKLIEGYAASGGEIVACGPAPTLVDARPSDRGPKLAAAPGFKQATPRQAAEMLVPVLGLDRCAIRRAAGDKGILFHQRRQLSDGQLLLLVNTSIEAPSRGFVEAQAKSVQRWDLFTGAVGPHPFQLEQGAAKVAFDLPPCGSLLLLLSSNPAAASTAVAGGAPGGAKTRLVAAAGPLEIRRVEPNVLKLDFVDLSTGGKHYKNLYYYRANDLAWQAAGMKQNPWDSAVQFQDELISKKFPPQSGFEATYRFTIAGDVPGAFWIVIERPDLYTITCNGRPISASKDSWWLDKVFGKIDITAAIRSGENAVSIRARPFTIYHELAAAYLLGDFGLQSAASGFVVVPPTPLSIAKGVAHSTDLEGVSWLSSGVGFDGNPAKDDRAPQVSFDLGKGFDLVAIDVWNYNEAAIAARGARKIEVVGATTLEGADPWSIRLGTFELASAPGGPVGAHTAMSERFSAVGRSVRFVKFRMLSNQAGTTFPALGHPKDDGFVGLSEVRFYAKAGGKNVRLRGVKIQSVSSELVQPGGFERRAVHLLDGSGLGEAGRGWNVQGLPFYSAGVAYRQTFTIAEPSGRYVVRVPSWYGSVAKVTVNGKLCGHLVSRPFEVDVTDAVGRGENAVEVLVIGTLKNTLGPHHAGSVVGSAWPGMFRQGPEQGPPPGAAYHTLGYGLFAPFQLRQSP